MHELHLLSLNPALSLESGVYLSVGIRLALVLDLFLEDPTELEGVQRCTLLLEVTHS